VDFPHVILQLAHIHPRVFFFFVSSIETNTHMPRVISSSLLLSLVSLVLLFDHISRYTSFLFPNVLNETLGRVAQ
jgi:hypothetical protein